MHSNKKISLAVAAIILLLPTLVSAATTNPQDKAGDYNVVLLTLTGLMIILLFAIGMLANTLKQLSFAVRDKLKKENEAMSDTTKTLLVLLALGLSGLYATAARAVEAVQPVAAAPDVISGMPATDFYSIIFVIMLELLVIFMLVFNIKAIFKGLSDKPELAKAAKVIAEKSWFWDKFNAAVPMEKEKDLLLDHNYDGIQELDNSLPPWWKYGFYLTILVAGIYLYRYHISHDGPSQQEEYATEMQQGEEDKAAYLAKSSNNVDESNVVLLTDAASVSDGREMFTKTCAACHLADGGGAVGPNLTDEYWLHGGEIKDIFKTIKYGWQDKGMKSWKDDYSPKQIQELASFVKSLKGTHPSVPKAPQGDLFIEALQSGKADSTSKTDSSKTSKVALK